MLGVAEAMAVDVVVSHCTFKSVNFNNSPFHKFSAGAVRNGTTISKIIVKLIQNRTRYKNLAIKI